MTRTRTVMGSPLYMSPEQMTSTRDVDGRTDIWALGVILYELLAGQPPFSADTMPQLCGLILSGPTPTIRTIRPSIPAGLDAVLRRCLEKDPTRRYPNIAEFTGALAEFAPKRARVSIDRVSRVIQSASMTNSGVVIGGTPGGRVQTGDSWADTKQGTPPKASRKGLWLAVFAGAVLVVAGVVFARRRAVPVEATVVAEPLPARAAAPSIEPRPAETNGPSITSPPPALPAVPSATAAPASVPANPAAAPASRPEMPRPGVKRPPAAPVAHTAAVPAPAPAPAAKPPSDLFDDRK
jgi:serine/threonine-protein kinase